MPDYLPVPWRPQNALARIGQAPSTDLAQLVAQIGQGGGAAAPSLGTAPPTVNSVPFGPPSPSMAQRAVAQLGGGQGGGFLSNKATGLSTEGMGLRSLARGSLGRAGLMGLGGQLVGSGIESAFGDPNESWDNSLASAARWGGAGAAAGSLIAPGIGTAIGGGLGLGIGAVKGFMDSKNEGDKAVEKALNDRSGQLNELLGQLGASADLREQAQFQLQMGVTAGGATTKSQVNDVYAQVKAMLPEAIMADRQQQEQSRMQESNMAAVQAWMGPMMEQQLSQAQWYADQWGNQASAAAQQIEDPGMRAAQQALASSIPGQQAAANAAYAAQIAAAPSAWGYQSDLLSQMRQAQQQLTQQPGGMDAIMQMMQAA